MLHEKCTCFHPISRKYFSCVLLSTLLETGYCWWTSEVPQIVMVSLVHCSWTTELPLVVMIFLVHFSFFLLIINSKSALACLDGKLFKEAPCFCWIYNSILIKLLPFTILTSFCIRFTTNQPKNCSVSKRKRLTVFSGCGLLCFLFIYLAHDA